MEQPMQEKATIMDEAAMQRALMRISHEILEKNRGAENLCVLGILRRGCVLAQKICENIFAIEGVQVPCGKLDIHFYTGDLHRVAPSPVVRCTALGFSVEGKKVILVDDVIYTGRTVRAAIDAIFSLGSPAGIELAVLIDRGHRELPIRADYVGKNLPTAKSEFVRVMVPPYDESTGVALYAAKKGDGAALG